MKRFFQTMLLLMAMVILGSGTASATTYIKEVGIYYLKKGSIPMSGTRKDYCFHYIKRLGYTPLDLDLNCGGGGGDVYLGYKTTTNPDEAIKDIVIMKGYDYWPYVYGDNQPKGMWGETDNMKYLHSIDIDGRTFTAAPTLTIGEELDDQNNGTGKWTIGDCNTDLNAEAGGEYLYVYTTKERDPESGIMGITNLNAFAQSNSTVNVGEDVLVARAYDGETWYPNVDLNWGTKKHHLYVYLSYKAERVQRLYMEDFYPTSWDEVLNSTNKNIIKGKYNSGEGLSTVFNETATLSGLFHEPIIIENCEDNKPYTGTLETPLFNLTGRDVIVRNSAIIQNTGKGAAVCINGGSLCVLDGTLKSAGTAAVDFQDGRLQLMGGTITYAGNRPASGFAAIHMHKGTVITNYGQTEFSRFYGISTESDHVYDLLPDGYTLATVNGSELTPLTAEQMSGQRITGKLLTLVPCPHHGVSPDIFEDGEYMCVNCGHMMNFHLKHTVNSATDSKCSTCKRDIIATVSTADLHTEYLCSLDTLNNYLNHLYTTSPLGTVTLAVYKDIEVPANKRITYKGTNEFKVVNGPLSDNVTISGLGYLYTFNINSKNITFDGVSLSTTGTGYGVEALKVENGKTIYFKNGSIQATQKPSLVVEEGSALILSDCDFDGFSANKEIQRIPRGKEQTLYTLNGSTYQHYEGEETASNETHLYVRPCDHSSEYTVSEGITLCKWCNKVFYAEGKEPFYAILNYKDEDGEHNELLTEFGEDEFDLVNSSTSPATLTLFKDMRIDAANGTLESGHELTITHDESTADGELNLNVTTSGYETRDWDLNSIYVDPNATLNIQGVNITNEYHWAITNEGTVNLYSGTITAAQAIDNLGTFNMYGGTLVGRQDSKATYTDDSTDFGTVAMRKDAEFNMRGGTIRTESTVEDTFIDGNPSTIRQRAFYLENKTYEINIYDGQLENGFVNYLVPSKSLHDLISSNDAYVRVGGELCTQTESIQQTDKTIIVGHCTDHKYGEWAETGRDYEESTSTLTIHESRTCEICGTADSQNKTIESLAAIFTDGYDTWYYTPEEVAEGLRLPGFSNATATLTLYKDMTAKEQITVTGGITNLTVEGNNNTLSSEFSEPLFNVTDGATATFRDLNMHATGQAIHCAASTVTLNGGHLVSETQHTVEVLPNSTFVMNDGTLEAFGDLTCRDLKAFATSTITIHKGIFLNDSQTTGIDAGQSMVQTLAEGSAYYLDSECQNPLIEGLTSNSIIDKELYVGACTSHFCTSEPSGTWICAKCRKSISETPVAHVQIEYVENEESKTNDYYTNNLDAALDYINNYSTYSAKANVTLMADAEVKEPHTFNSKSYIEIQGNNHTISSTQDFPIFETGAQSLTLSDLNLQTTGNVPAIYAVEGSLVINGGNYSAANDFHALVASDCTNVEVSGGTFEGGVLCGTYSKNQETESTTATLVDVLDPTNNFKYTDSKGNECYMKPYEIVGSSNKLVAYTMLLGDANHDGRISISDITDIIANLNGGTAVIDPMQANVSNVDEYTIDINDVEAINNLLIKK